MRSLIALVLLVASAFGQARVSGGASVKGGRSIGRIAPGEVVTGCALADVSGRTLIDACGVYGGGNYYLAGSLSSEGTCISVVGNLFDLAMQGHEITYATNPATFTTTNDAGVSITVGASSEQALPRPQGGTGYDGTMATVTNISNSFTCSDGAKTRGVHYRLAVDGFNGNPAVFHWLIKPAENVTCSIPSYTYTFPRFGIINATSDSYVRNTGNTLGGGNGMSVQCGTITAAATAPAFNMPIFVSNHTTPTIKNMVLNCRGWSAPAFGLTYVAGATVQNNTLNCDSANSALFNRMAFEGYAGWNRNNSTALAGLKSVFSGNTVTDSVHGGLIAYQDNSEMFGNTIRQRSRYTNDFALNGSRTGTKIYSNTVDNYDALDATVSGRGAMCGTNGEIYGNTIRVHGAATNQEYGGCQAGGTYGIQSETGVTNCRIHDNNIFAYTRTCDARGLRITTAGGTTVTGDIIEAIRHDDTATGKAIALSAREANGLRVIGAILRADTWIVEDQSQTTANAPSNVRYEGAIFTKGLRPAANFHTWSMENYAQLTGTTALHTCVDCQAQNGASLTDVAGHTIDGYWKAWEIWIKWTRTVHVTDGTNPISGAAVSMVDAAGSAVSLTTDAAGNAALEVPEYRFYNSASVAVNTDGRNPFTLQISKAGCTTLNASGITVTGKSTDDRALSCPTLALSSISISPAGAVLLVSDYELFSAMCHWSDGSTSDCTSSAAWGAGAGLVLTDDAGYKRVTNNACASGSRQLTATSGSVSGSVTIDCDEL
jgi:hypothetical protein